MYAIKILKIIVSLHIFTRKILFNLRFILFLHLQIVNDNYDNNEIIHVWYTSQNQESCGKA